MTKLRDGNKTKLGRHWPNKTKLARHWPNKFKQARHWPLNSHAGHLQLKCFFALCDPVTLIF